MKNAKETYFFHYPKFPALFEPFSDSQLPSRGTGDLRRSEAVPSPALSSQGQSSPAWSQTGGSSPQTGLFNNLQGSSSCPIPQLH